MVNSDDGAQRGSVGSCETSVFEHDTASSNMRHDPLTMMDSIYPTPEEVPAIQPGRGQPVARVPLVVGILCGEPRQRSPEHISLRTEDSIVMQAHWTYKDLFSKTGKCN